VGPVVDSPFRERSGIRKPLDLGLRCPCPKVEMRRRIDAEVPRDVAEFVCCLWQGRPTTDATDVSCGVIVRFSPLALDQKGYN
jgi:hypothetical protein